MAAFSLPGKEMGFGIRNQLLEGLVELLNHPETLLTYYFCKTQANPIHSQKGSEGKMRKHSWLFWLTCTVCLHMSAEPLPMCCPRSHVTSHGIVQCLPPSLSFQLQFLIFHSAKVPTVSCCFPHNERLSSLTLLLLSVNSCHPPI